MAVYSSQTGEAFFRNGGLLEIMLPFEEGPFATGEDASRAVENVLHGASALPKELGMTARQEGEGWILEAEQQFQGEPVFNGVLSARLAGGGMSFFGRRVTQSDGARLDAAKNAAELVLCLGSVLSGRAENVRVDAVRQGWIASAGEEGGTLLTPAWEVKVQNETLYLDLVTGLAVIPE